MKIHLRFDKSNAEHTQATVFVNGKYCGQLTLGTEDAASLCQVLSLGLNLPTDEFVSNGRRYPDNQN